MRKTTFIEKIDTLIFTVIVYLWIGYLDEYPKLTTLQTWAFTIIIGLIFYELMTKRKVCSFILSVISCYLWCKVITSFIFNKILAGLIGKLAENDFETFIIKLVIGFFICVPIIYAHRIFQSIIEFNEYITKKSEKVKQETARKEQEERNEEAKKYAYEHPTYFSPTNDSLIEILEKHLDNRIVDYGYGETLVTGDFIYVSSIGSNMYMYVNILRTNKVDHHTFEDIYSIVIRINNSIGKTVDIASFNKCNTFNTIPMYNRIKDFQDKYSLYHCREFSGLTQEVDAYNYAHQNLDNQSSSNNTDNQSSQYSNSQNDQKQSQNSKQRNTESGAGAESFLNGLFDGCNDLASLEKRYHQLLKIYHPDQANGDTQMSQKIQATYSKLNAQYR